METPCKPYYALVESYSESSLPGRGLEEDGQGQDQPQSRGAEGLGGFLGFREVVVGPSDCRGFQSFSGSALLGVSVFLATESSEVQGLRL